jgi:hypothetical protein
LIVVSWRLRCVLIAFTTAGAAFNRLEPAPLRFNSHILSPSHFKVPVPHFSLLSFPMPPP